MLKNRNLASIDVGTTKICTMLGHMTDKGDVRVLSVGVSDPKGFEKGFVVSINEARESIRESVKRAEEASSGVKVESACVGVLGRHVDSMTNRGVVTISRSGHLVRPVDLKRAIAGAQNIRVPYERRLLHVIPRSYSVDSQTGIKNPVGMHGFRLDVDTHVITATTASVQNLVKCIRNTGVDIDDLVLEPLASSEALLTENERDAGAILIDIGGGIIDTAIFRQGALWHRFTLPLGGNQFTRDISLGLGIPFDVAEKIKVKHGMIVLPSQIDEECERRTEVREDGSVILLRDLYEIIYVRMDEILDIIRAELPDESEIKTPFTVVLTGGSAKLRGIELLTKEKFDGPVRIGIPKVTCEVPGLLVGPEHAAAVGLLLWQSGHLGKESLWKSWRKRNIKSSVPETVATEDALSLAITEDFEEAKRFFAQNKKRLLTKHRGRYIAILGNRVVDSDVDFDSLAKRVYRQFGYRAIYMPKVVAETPIIHVPVPRFTFHKK